MLQFVDCDLGVRESGLGLPSLATPRDALALMDRYGISRALVYDRSAMETGAFGQFDGILAYCQSGGGRLVPAIPVAPPACGESPPPDELVDIVLTRGIKALRVWPEYYAYSFDPFTFGPLLERLETHRIPVLVCMSESHSWGHRSGWREVRETAQAFPALPIVVLWSGMRDGRRLLPLLEGCPNVLADLNCVTFQFIEYVTERFGSGRLVFASHFPLSDPGLYLPYVNYSAVDGSARQQIAGGTLTALVEGIR
jgi:predicted TIM-barrel fold metal-dependent hydrolase